MKNFNVIIECSKSCITYSAQQTSNTFTTTGSSCTTSVVVIYSWLLLGLISKFFVTQEATTILLSYHLIESLQSKIITIQPMLSLCVWIFLIPVSVIGPSFICDLLCVDTESAGII